MPTITAAIQAIPLRVAGATHPHQLEAKLLRTEPTSTATIRGSIRRLRKRG